MFTEHNSSKTAPTQSELCVPLLLLFLSLDLGFKPIGWCPAYSGQVFPSQFPDTHANCLWKHSQVLPKMCFNNFLDVFQSSHLGNQYQPSQPVPYMFVISKELSKRKKNPNFHAADT